MTSSRRIFRLAVLGALLGFGSLAHAGILGAIAHKVAEHHVEDRVKGLLPEPEDKPPVELPQGSGFAQCADFFPGGVPMDVRRVDARWKPRALCSGRYAVLYSGLSKTPLLVVERLSRAQLADALDEARTNEFFSDPRIPATERAQLSDYAGSGYDRGHMAPAADMPDRTAMAQSFTLSNMVPQDPFNNREVWSKIESDTRKFARRADGYVYVFTGPQFKASPQKTIGRGQVWVPSHLFKLVYDQASGRSWAHLLPNTGDARVGRPVAYEDFVRETGWRPLEAGALAAGTTTSSAAAAPQRY